MPKQNQVTIYFKDYDIEEVRSNARAKSAALGIGNEVDLLAAIASGRVTLHLTRKPEGNGDLSKLTFSQVMERAALLCEAENPELAQELRRRAWAVIAATQ